jgi:hypothetical protein
MSQSWGKDQFFLWHLPLKAIVWDYFKRASDLWSRGKGRTQKCMARIRYFCIQKLHFKSRCFAVDCKQNTLGLINCCDNYIDLWKYSGHQNFNNLKLFAKTFTYKTCLYSTNLKHEHKGKSKVLHAQDRTMLPGWFFLGHGIFSYLSHRIYMYIFGLKILMFNFSFSLYFMWKFCYCYLVPFAYLYWFFF